MCRALTQPPTDLRVRRRQAAVDAGNEAPLKARSLGNAERHVRPTRRAARRRHRPAPCATDTSSRAAAFRCNKHNARFRRQNRNSTIPVRARAVGAHCPVEPQLLERLNLAFAAAATATVAVADDEPLLGGAFLLHFNGNFKPWLVLYSDDRGALRTFLVSFSMRVVTHRSRRSREAAAFTAYRQVCSAAVVRRWRRRRRRRRRRRQTWSNRRQMSPRTMTSVSSQTTFCTCGSWRRRRRRRRRCGCCGRTAMRRRASAGTVAAAAAADQPRQVEAGVVVRRREIPRRAAAAAAAAAAVVAVAEAMTPE